MLRNRHSLVAVLAAALAGGCAQAAIGDAEGGDGGAGEPDGEPAPIDAAPPADAALPCVEGALNAVDPLGGHCYMFFEALTPWSVALGACNAIGPTTHLATPTSLAENEVIAALVGPQADVWMGGNDQMIEMQWQWVTGEAFAFDNWRTGEPNDANVGEDCMVMEVDNGGTWDDRPCDAMYGYFCERE